MKKSGAKRVSAAQKGRAPAPLEPQEDPQELSASQKHVLELQARICKTMGHPVRLFLLHHLYATRAEVGSSELARLAGISPASLSQHVAKMTAVGLVKARREGKFVLVSLARIEIGRACELVSSALSGNVAERAALVIEDPAKRKI